MAVNATTIDAARRRARCERLRHEGYVVRQGPRLMWVPGTRFPRLRTEYWSPGELPTPPWTPMPYKRQTAPAVSHHGTQKPAPTVRDDVAPYVVKSLDNRQWHCATAEYYLSQHHAGGQHVTTCVRAPRHPHWVASEGAQQLLRRLGAPPHNGERATCAESEAARGEYFCEARDVWRPRVHQQSGHPLPP
jgi:hypothetical protein